MTSSGRCYHRKCACPKVTWLPPLAPSRRPPRPRDLQRVWLHGQEGIAHEGLVRLADVAAEVGDGYPERDLRRLLPLRPPPRPLPRAVEAVVLEVSAEVERVVRVFIAIQEKKL